MPSGSCRPRPPPRRHTALPMVCRCWNELCYSPELLRGLDVHLGGDLCSWQGYTVGSR